MNTQEMHDVMIQTQAGELIFPEVVRRLSAIGVESYFVDFSSGRETLYTAEGGCHVERMTLPQEPIHAEFSAAGIVAAIRGAQSDTIRYPEFAKKAAATGVIGYWAFLTGKKVIYFGRKGELHIEEFPRPNA